MRLRQARLPFQRRKYLSPAIKTAQNQTMTVVATEAEVRANPSPDAQVVTKVMDTNNGFAHVQTPDGAKGYIDLRSLK